MQNRRGEPARKLSAIAPKEEPLPLLSTAATPPGGGDGSSPTQRRLPPPRSRTGCWTCRERKVKCSEEKPSCAQCARLGYECDYNPKLSFKDETPRVLGGSRGSRSSRSARRISTVGNSVWEPQPRSREGSETRRPAAEDNLPPFSDLTNDEDRERKAGTKDPGTFHVVVNPESFSDLPEYRDAGELGAPTSSLSEVAAGKRRASEPSYEDDDRGDDGRQEIEDPNVVILRHFEDPGRRPSIPTSPRTSASPANTATLATSLTPNLDKLTVSTAPGSRRSSLAVETPGSEDAMLIENYRKTISPLIMWNREEYPEGDLFEQEAANFPPLYHTMLALSSLSLAYRTGQVDSLEHYKQIFPSLNAIWRSDQDMTSDGILFTHFFLLLYHVAAAEQGGSNMWLPHIRSLSVIIRNRHELYGDREPHKFITFFVCVIDSFATLSSCSNGELVDMLVKNHLLPAGPEALPPLGSGSTSTLYPEEEPTFRSILRFNVRVMVLACRIGQLAGELRAESGPRQYADGPLLMLPQDQQTLDRHARVAEIRNELMSVWRNEMPPVVQELGLDGLAALPERCRNMFHHAASLYRTSMVYSRSSMWPSQRAEATAADEAEIDHCVAAILKTAQEFVRTNGLHLRFVVFPLFISGFASNRAEDKVLALELVRTFEQASPTRNATTVRQLLQAVYRRQEQSLLQSGTPWHVDWTAVMLDSQLQVVNHGF